MNVLGFYHLKEMYIYDLEFKEIYEACENLLRRNRTTWIEYMLQEGLLFNGSQLCIPKYSMINILLKEKHGEGLERHFGQNKTYAQLSSFYYWSGMRADVKNFVEK